MGILHRYILKEHIGPFFFALFTITFILVLDLLLEIIDLLLRKGIGIRVVSEVFFYNLAWMLALSVPMAVLVATLMAFGRLSADNEIIAMETGGVGLLRLILPPLVASIILAVLLVIFNNVVLPEFNHRARILMSAIHKKKPTLSLKDKEGLFINDIPGYSILIKKVDQRHSKIQGITIYQKTSRESPLVIRAKSGEVEYSKDEDILTLILYDGELHQIDEQNPNRYIRTKFKRHLVRICGVGGKLYTQASKYRGDRELSAKMMLEKIAEYRQQIRSYEIEINNIVKIYFNGYSVRKIRKLAFSSPAGLTPEQQRALLKLRSKLQEIEIRQRNINKYLVEVHKKYSIPVACIVFVLIGAPLGIMARRGGMAVGFGMSIGFFLLYWAFLIGGEELADRMIIPPALAMWAPNILIGLGGVFLIIHSVRQITFFRWEEVKTYIRKIKLRFGKLMKNKKEAPRHFGV